MLRSAKDNKNGIVVEITKEAEKRKCKVEDMSSLIVKYKNFVYFL